MTRVCLVTEELYPFTAGGIGRLAHNLISAALARDPALELHLLLPSTSCVEAQQVASTLGPRCVPHYALMREPSAPWSLAFHEGEIYPPAGAFTDCREHAESLDFLIALRRLADEGLRFDVIEFPDYRGWAYCTLQEKRLDPAFPHGEVAVRLHSTAGIIEHLEGGTPTRVGLGRRELERKALLDADRIITHLRPIAEFNRSFYGFDDAWMQRVRVAFPPVADPPRAASRRERRDLVFVSKVQRCKRPDLFVRGAALFMRETPAFTGSAILACHAFDAGYLEEIRRLIPADLRHRFTEVGAGPVREQLSMGNIVVIPSEYESLCLSAYEAAAAGATLVLNGACPAFGSGTPWDAPGVCHRFDGTARGLAAALAEAFATPAPNVVAWQADPEPWPVSGRPRVRVETGGREARVSVLLTNFNLGRYLPEALASVAMSTHLETEVILVDDASTEPFDRALLDHLEQDGAVRVIRNQVNLGLPASRNVGLAAATGDYVLPLDADDCLGPSFLRLAVGALERHPDFDVVVPQVAYFESDEALAARAFCDYAIFLGDVPSLGLLQNRLSSATALMRRKTIQRFGYDEGLTAYEDWNLYLRMAHAGVRFLTTSGLHFFYRRRPGSMVRGVDPRRHHELMVRTLEKLPRPYAPGAQPFALVLPALEQLDRLDELEAQVPVVRTPEPDLRHKLVDRVDEGLKRVPYLQPALRRVTLEAARLIHRK